MFERKNQPLASLSVFVKRIIFAVFFGAFVVVCLLCIGMMGLAKFEGMSAINSFANAAMIVSGVGAITPITTYAGKLFSGIYSVCGGIVFMSVIAIVFSPVIHRWFHKFHLDG